jgi:putative cardiolipin synthase
MKPVSSPSKRISVVLLVLLAAACSTLPKPPTDSPESIAAELERARAASVFGPPSDFDGSRLPDVGTAGLYPVRTPEQCEVAVLDTGEDSFALRLAMLKSAQQSIRIQALIFKGDESGLRVAEILKQKHAQGVDVRVIVDALSNPPLQSQWMLFDLKQHGIEVEGYEALGLQWINEIPVPGLMPNYDPARPDKRFHEKLWLIDVGTPDGIGVTGGLNIGNEYFRVDPENPAGYWRDQDVAVRGPVLADLANAFDRTFDYLVAIKQSRGIFNTNLYWDATRKAMNTTGKLDVSYRTDPRLVARVAELEARPHVAQFRAATCRFFHHRPRFAESYILQAYLRLIESARMELLIANAYFVPTPAISAALKEAAARCVAVTLISNSPDTNDLPEISLVGRGHYTDLLSANAQAAACPNADAGIHIFEWTGRAADDPVVQGTLHSKFAVVDRRTSLVGSYNLDPRSERLNGETALVFENADLASRLAQLLLQRDLRYSHRITAAEAANFADPEETITRFRKRIGHLFEAEL